MGRGPRAGGGGLGTNPGPGILGAPLVGITGGPVKHKMISGLNYIVPKFHPFN